MSLFGKLIRLRSDERCPLEDFLTEIVANVLANDLTLTLAWLRALGITNICKADKITVTTQVNLSAIAGKHDVGSRPDIEIRLSDEGVHEIVFVESKVGSSESDGQLQRYMDHLAIQSGFSRKTLLFITRDYEPKGNLSSDQAQFVQTRWSEFHRFIRERQCQSTIVRELLFFMKENNMSQSNRFTAIDLIALTNHSHAHSLMEATLGEATAENFKTMAGMDFTKTWGIKERFRQIHESENYSKGFTMYAWPTGDSHQIGFAIGYWFPDEQPLDSPILGMKICVDPRATEYGEIEQSMRRFAKSSASLDRKWEYHDKDMEWEGLECTAKLECFLASEDHIAAIRTWFSELLDDAASFKTGSPELPWLAV